jgi:cyclic lactone autoinducer peptide
LLQEIGVFLHLPAQTGNLWYNTNAKRRKGVADMSNLAQKLGGLLAALAILLTTATMNAACSFIMYQDALPEEAKKLRKF